MINYLSVEELTHHWGETVLFDNISFGIAEGQKVALIAKNGAGKTTLLNILAGKIAAEEGKVTYRKGINIGYLPQEPELNNEQTVIESVFSSENKTVALIQAYEKALEENNQEALGTLIEQMDHNNAWDYEQRIKQVLSQLKITKFDQIVRELSGGQRKRVALANILINEPEFIILDEPTNHLDLDMIEWLEGYLEKSKMTLLMVTHDRYFLDRVCNEIIELADESIYQYNGNYSYFIEKRIQRIEQRTAEIEKARNLMRREQVWMNRMPQARGHKAKYRVDAFHDLKAKATQSLNSDELNLDIKASRLGKKILNLEDVSKKYDDLTILDNFNYKFAKGEKVGIVGNNGTGKSTFLNIITGQKEPDSGSLEVGETIVFGYFRQDGIQIDEDKKVIDVITDISENIDLGGDRKMSAGQFLRYFLFPNEMHHIFVNKLSGGEKKRLYLMTILMKNPNFLILDEPTNDLDIFTLAVLEDYLKAFEGCLIIVSHDRFFMDNLVDHLFIFKGEGDIKDFPGNYSDLQMERERELREDKKQQKAQKQPIEKKINTDKPKKLSFKEKLEFEQLEKDIEQLEEEKTDLETQLNSGTLTSEVLTEKAQRIGEIIEILEEKEMRWLELSELS